MKRRLAKVASIVFWVVTFPVWIHVLLAFLILVPVLYLVAITEYAETGRWDGPFTELRYDYEGEVT